MDEKTSELLHQIAIDVAVIKNELGSIKELKQDFYIAETEITKIKGQLAVVKWLGGVLGSGMVGLFLKLFTAKLI